MPKNIKISVDPDIKEEAILRRYLDLAKFLDLLRTKSLYLTRTDRLSDKFEGALTPGIRKTITEAYSKGITKYDADDFIRKSREGNYINCWTLGASDNMALWQLYGSASTGVAITSTKEKLIHACLGWAKNDNVEIFKVKYIDHFKNPDMIIGSYTDPLRFKHKAYRYEQEVRIVLSKIKQNELKQHAPNGIRLPVELNSFIRSVVIAPEADSWFYELVSDIAERYDLNVPVRRSKLTWLPK